MTGKRLLFALLLAAGVSAGSVATAGPLPVFRLALPSGPALHPVQFGAVLPPAVPADPREANREVQMALNHFGYEVGTPDGVLGARSRAAISRFQGLLGYPQTGTLTPFERGVLVAAHRRALEAAPETQRMAASHPLGGRGVALMQRDVMAGLPGAGFGAVAMPVPAPGGAAMPSFGSPPQPAAPQGQAMPSFGTPDQPAAPQGLAMPSFGLPGGALPPALPSEQCRRVAEDTARRGGWIDLASMADPAEALAEQFCLARDQVMAQGRDLAARVPGATPAQIAAQCDSLGPLMQAPVDSLADLDPDSVIGAVAAFVATTGMAPAQVSATARICLGAGYDSDKLPVVLASALLLTQQGEAAYGELIGHHLAQGSGIARSPARALPWFERALSGLAADAPMLLAPQVPARAALLGQAARTLAARDG